MEIPVNQLEYAKNLIIQQNEEIEELKLMVNDLKCDIQTRDFKIESLKQGLMITNKTLENYDKDLNDKINENSILQSKLNIANQFISEVDTNMLEMLIRIEKGKENERRIKSLERLLHMYSEAGYHKISLGSVYMVLNGRDKY